MTVDSALTLLVVGMAFTVTMLIAVVVVVRRMSGKLRDVWQQGRSLGGLVYREERKTRALIRELGGRP